MPVLLGLLCLLPMILGLIIEYIVSQKTQKRWCQWVFPIIVLVMAGIIAAIRWSLWTSGTVSPVTQLLLVPGIPCSFMLLGCWFGVRLWKYFWGPKVISKKKLK